MPQVLGPSEERFVAATDLGNGWVCPRDSLECFGGKNQIPLLGIKPQIVWSIPW
jgi:hypothetical protein